MAEIVVYVCDRCGASSNNRPVASKVLEVPVEVKRLLPHSRPERLDLCEHCIEGLAEWLQQHPRPRL